MIISEAMAAVRGPERGTEDFAPRAGIALIARPRQELAHARERALGGGGGVLERLGRPDASHRVAAVPLELRRIPR